MAQERFQSINHVSSIKFESVRHIIVAKPKEHSNESVGSAIKIVLIEDNRLYATSD